MDAYLLTPDQSAVLYRTGAELWWVKGERRERVTGLDAADVAERAYERTVFDREIAPADDPVVPQQRQRVVAQFPLRRRRVRLEPVGPSPEEFESMAVVHDRIERREQAHRVISTKSRKMATGA